MGRKLATVTESQPPGYASSLSFLLSQVGGRSAQLFADLLHPLGVSPRAFGVLSNLAAEPLQTQQRLADALGIHRNNMVTLVDEMETAGWVRRNRSAVDRRAFQLELTRRGAAVVAKVARLIPDLDTAIGQGLTGAERAKLVALLAKTAQNLELPPGVHPHLRSSNRSGG